MPMASTSAHAVNPAIVSMRPIAGYRRFGAKPDKKIVDRSSGEPELMEDAFHCNSDGLVVGVCGGGGSCLCRWALRFALYEADGDAAKFVSSRPRKCVGY